MPVLDLRSSLRALKSAPGFTLLVVLTLALGIGANTLLFSIVNGVLLNPLPYPRSSQLVAIYASTSGTAHSPITYPNFLDWQKDSHAFASMAIYRNQDYNFTGAGDAERISGLMISADFFPTLGVSPALGRPFRATDDQPGAAPVAVIDDGFWHRSFGASPAILGSAVELNGVLYTVVGVLPRGFAFYGRTRDVYTPIGQWMDPSFRDRRISVSALAIGRLQPGVTLRQAQADMDGIANALSQNYPQADKGVGIALVSMKQDIVGNVQPYLLLLLAACGFLLLIACVNVANLLLARSSGRAVEFAVRAALGAGRHRILGRLLGESLLLASLGGVLGFAFALAARRAIAGLLPSGLPGTGSLALHGRVLGFTFAVTLLAGILFGSVPALKISRMDIQTVLRSGGLGWASGRRALQSVFVSVQVGLALVLLVGAGLMLRSLAALWHVNPGYDRDHAITFNVSLPATPTTTSAQTRARLRALDAAVASLPGVEAESVTLGSRPMIHDSAVPLWVVGRPKPANDNDMPQSLFYLAESGYARAMGLTLLRGRFISDNDDEHAPPVIVIDDAFARGLFPGQGPIGQSVYLTQLNVQAKIVGVVAHVRQWGLQADPAAAIAYQFYYPFMQLPEHLMPLAAGAVAVIVRTRDDPSAIVAPLRALVRQNDPREIVYEVQTLDDLVAGSLAARRLTMLLLGVFGGLALVLAAVGIYGVTAYLVGRRTREIGIRVALGGRRARVIRLILGDTLRMALWGVAAGMTGATLLTRSMRAMLYGVSSADPVTYAGVGALLILIALLAGYVPARRAAHLDPLAALRSE